MFKKTFHEPRMSTAACKCTVCQKEGRHSMKCEANAPNSATCWTIRRQELRTMEAKFQKELNTPAFDEHQRNKSLDARRYNYRCWDLPLLREQREAYEKECKKGKGPDDRKLLKLAGQWHNVGTNVKYSRDAIDQIFKKKPDLTGPRYEDDEEEDSMGYRGPGMGVGSLGR